MSGIHASAWSMRVMRAAGGTGRRGRESSDRVGFERLGDELVPGLPQCGGRAGAGKAEQGVSGFFQAGDDGLGVDAIGRAGRAARQALRVRGAARMSNGSGATSGLVRGGVRQGEGHGGLCHVEWLRRCGSEEDGEGVGRALERGVVRDGLPGQRVAGRKRWAVDALDGRAGRAGMR